MDSFRPVFWHEGMFLRPQHFQQQDAYFESRFHHLISLINPYAWGIVDLVVNQPALENMTFEIEQCKLLLPDGAVLNYPGNTNLECRSFEDVRLPGGEPLPVYLGVMRLRPGENNVVSIRDPKEPSDTRRRYIVKETGSPTYDFFALEQTAQIDFLVTDVRLFFGDERKNATDFQLFKIAEIERTSAGYSLSKQYVPPSAKLSATPLLLEMVKSVRDRMTAKGRELMEFKRERGIQTREIGSRDMLHLLYALTINRYIPILYHVCETCDAIHPLHVYGLLREIVGSFSAFSERVTFFGATEDEGGHNLPEYAHEDLWNCFNPAVRLIKRLLNDLVAGAGYTATLTWDGVYYSTDLEKRIFEGNSRFYFIITTSLPLNELLIIMKDTAKVCSREGMPTLINRALFGVPVEHLSSPPHELPQRSHAHHFLLDHTSRVWKRVEEDSNIAIWFEKQPGEDIHIEISVLFEDN